MRPYIRTSICGYPGQFAPASLKPVKSAELRQTRLRYPGQFAPASLKRDLHELCPAHVLALSGAIRPGLIEATRLDLINNTSPFGYPGQFAPASLKHHRRGGGAFRRTALLSGAIRPGLIEAACRDAPDAIRPQRYPGQFAPASLKPPLRRGPPRRGDHVIRGNSPRPH